MSTVGITFDEAEYSVNEGETITVAGRIIGLTGEIETDFSLTLNPVYNGDDLTGIYNFCINMYTQYIVYMYTQSIVYM